MNTIPTAEKFLNRGLDDSGFELTGNQLKIMARQAREFAKLHVEACKQDIAEKAKTCYASEWSEDIVVDKKSIYDAYPLENIK
jgi:hypothetical protein